MTWPSMWMMLSLLSMLSMYIVAGGAGVDYVMGVGWCVCRMGDSGAGLTL